MNFTARRFKAGLGVATLSAFLVVGCQDKVDESERIAQMLAPVPADTPYLIASLHEIPDDVFRHQMSLFAPRVANLVDAFGAMSMAEAKADDVDAKRFKALLDKFTAYMRDEAHWEQHRGVVYALDMFPVVRLSLSDPAKSTQELSDLHQAMDAAPDKMTRFGGDVFAVPLEDSGLSLYYGILGDFFIATILPHETQQDLLAQAFGAQAPASAMQAATLDAMAQQRGYGAGALGFFDTIKMYDEFMDPNSAMHQWFGGQVAEHDDVDINDLSPACRQEYREMVALLPRMEWGTTRNDKTGIASSSFIQLRSDLAQGLVDMTGDLTGLDKDPGSEFAFGASLRIGPMRDFIIQMARNVEAAPFQCENLSQLNQSANQILAQAATPVPPFVGQIRGVKMRMNGFDKMMNLEAPQAPEMSLALYVDNAQLLVSMMQLFVPQLAQVELPMDGTTVRIDEAIGEMLPGGDSPMFAALTEKSIGVAMGDAEAQVLPQMMKETGSGAGILFSSWIDYGSVLAAERKAMEQVFNHSDSDMDDATMDDEAMDDVDADDMVEALEDDDWESSDWGDDEAMADGDDYADVMEEDDESMHIKANSPEFKAMMNALWDLYMVMDRAGSVVRPTAEGVIVEQSITLQKP